MKEIVVLSGKGGTGKTMLVANYAALAKEAILADCDVDAPNLHLLMAPEVKESGPFPSMKAASIDGAKCVNCGECVPLCRFEAIKWIGNSSLRKVAISVDECEGCGVCARACPEGAISMVERKGGDWFISSTRYGTMVHALLEPGGENSGKLVALVKQKARMLARNTGAKLVIVDGPPGIGCAAISALSGANLVLLVTEPTKSGASDFTRALNLAESFRCKTCYVINRADINARMAEEIDRTAADKGVQCAGKIPYDDEVVASMALGKTVVESGKGEARKSIVDSWNALMDIVSTGDDTAASEGPHDR
ncbi:MAG: ATP-binding protein [Candidatus Thermoplasmatota archaeon]|nr:ATP-binding protein [Candidatus Thermoplasmatota archaeon]